MSTLFELALLIIVFMMVVFMAVIISCSIYLLIASVRRVLRTHKKLEDEV